MAATSINRHAVSARHIRRFQPFGRAVMGFTFPSADGSRGAQRCANLSPQNAPAVGNISRPEIISLLPTVPIISIAPKSLSFYHLRRWLIQCGKLESCSGEF